MLSVKNIAIGIKRSVVVVFESIELKSPDVIDKENIIPFGVAGNNFKILFDI